MRTRDMFRSLFLPALVVGALSSPGSASAQRGVRSGGEIEVQVWSALYGIWQGFSIPRAAGAEGDDPYVGVGLLLGGPAGFVIGRQLARAGPRSPGQARAITWGGTWGMVQGWGWARILDLGSNRPGRRGYGDDETAEAAFTMMIVGGAAGVASGLALAKREIAPGTATSAMLGSLWGMWIGASTAGLMNVDEGDGITAAAMMGGNAGLVLGAMAGSHAPLSRGRAHTISLGGLVGMFSGLGLSMIMGIDPFSVATTGPGESSSPLPLVFAGSLAGLAVGAIMTRGDRGESDESGEQRAAAALPPTPGALLNWSGGEWALSPPVPSATRLPTPRNGGQDGIAWKVPLLKVRF